VTSVAYAWLTGGRTALLLDTASAALPVVRHWGPAPPATEDAVGVGRALTPAQTQGSVDRRVHLDLCPSPVAGFQGTPGLRGAFGDGTGWAPRWERVGLAHDEHRLFVAAEDRRAGLALHVEVTIDEHDVVGVRAAVTNLRDAAATTATFPSATAGIGAGPRDGAPADTYHLAALALTLPVPDAAREVATFAGRWIRELHLQRQPWAVGRIERGTTRGRSSHEDPPTLFAGGAGFGEEHGRVWAFHLAWSGNHAVRAERTADGFAFVQAGEQLLPGELVLGPGDTYVTPWLLATASTEGLNGVSDAFHGHLRARAAHPRSPRPVTLNTWEAVYFDHDRRRLLGLVEAAAQLGIERFVLDDGWFGRRDDDTSSLGDWVVDERKHAGGLASLAARVREAGMQFGLWVEPEMINPDSDRFRADPSVTLGPPDTPSARSQQALDLARPAVWASVRDQLVAVLDDAEPDHLKWDHNRDLTVPDRDGRAAAHVQVGAAYALMDELRRVRPGLEIESCAGGGGRIDAGILEHTHRFWTSDCNDPVERQWIQRGASYLFPPELMGAHVGGPLSHTTARVTALPLRLATAFFGHLGVEWDVTTASDEDRERLAEAIALHKHWRDVLHGGRVVRVDHPDPAALVHGVVTPHRAVFAYVQLETAPWSRPSTMRCPGLLPAASYRVDILWPLTSDPAPAQAQPGWYAGGELLLTGHALATAGVSLHVHQPAAATVLTLTRVDG
jgi:alpha-galactosidase